MLWKIIGAGVLIVAGWIAYMAITVDPQAEKAEADYEAQHDAREAAEQAKQDAGDARKQAARDDAGTASDDRFQFDQKAAEAKAELQSVEVQVRECMHENAQLWLRQGVRSRSAIVAFSVKMCGSVPTTLLRQHGEPEKEIHGYLEALAYDELNNVLPAGQ